ncbi:tRNA glutamyl-Q(34) synthetase GluQRS [Hydrogenophaga sp.]|uniref:tRNA glutamyl-Q(34) synthetase GluQRS n=1 Tax=Hydrogenophaga sp. TaxID=1904254 RepID=UPI0027229522|nr:tRNA glutamyl-Q(34) synthetase GluQRS [Hydrogenophaga sp.]MDO8903720.1 tRNA glutamyl-Q(34) synthetase GluQRS [Hydrogenophaga sp.]
MPSLPLYRGRFAPSPTGPLHAGSLVAALASWLDARAHDGTWLVRIEDVDTPRCVPGADRLILQQLAACGMHSDEPVVWQSNRGDAYQRALDRLIEAGHAYPCGCSRKDIETALKAQGHQRERHQTAVYPGTCRPERGGLGGKPARAWRFACPAGRSHVAWNDRRLGAQHQDVSSAVGDFVLLRGDGVWAYQLAVVVDDADQGITCVVRGEDLADNTARQILLQRALALPEPGYLHTPLVRDAHGEKLSKQTGAQALDVSDPSAALNSAARCLGLPAVAGSVEQQLSHWTPLWREQQRTDEA